MISFNNLFVSSDKSNFINQVFCEALFPAHPFTLLLKSSDRVDEKIEYGEKISNRTTGEELSITWNFSEQELEIKITAAAKDKQA